MAQNNTPTTTLTLEQQTQLLALVETLRREKEEAEKALAEAKAKKSKGLYVKLSEKGAISLYGVRIQFPVTYYANEWERILGEGKELIEKFILENKDFFVAAHEDHRQAVAREKAAAAAAAPAPPAAAAAAAAVPAGKLDFATWRKLNPVKK